MNSIYNTNIPRAELTGLECMAVELTGEALLDPATGCIDGAGVAASLATGFAVPFTTSDNLLSNTSPEAVLL